MSPHGANPKCANACVAAAMWGGADSFELSLAAQVGALRKGCSQDASRLSAYNRTVRAMRWFVPTDVKAAARLSKGQSTVTLPQADSGAR